MADAKLELLADSSQIVKATKALDDVTEAGGRAEKSVSAFTKELQASGKKVAANGKVYDAFGLEVKQATAELERLSKVAPQAATKPANAFGNLGYSAGQAGIQIQQFVGQIQGGQSAMLALSQQSADLGFVLGAPLVGAVVGLGASIAGFLLPSLVDSAEKTEELVGRIKDLEEASKATAAQNRFLAQVNNDEANALSERNEEIAKQIKLLEDQIELQTSAGTGTDTGTFAVPRSAEENQKRYAESVKESREEITRLRAELDTNNQELKALSEETANLGKANDDSTEKLEKMKQSLQAQIIALQDGAMTAEVYAATQALIAEGLQEQIPEVVALIQKKYELKAADEAATQAAREQAQAVKEEEQAYDAFLKKLEQAEAAEVRAEEQKVKNFENLKQSIILQQDQLRLDNEQYELRKNLLALGPSATDEQIRQITSLTNSMQQLRFEAELIGPTLQESFADIGVNAIGSMSDALASALVNSESLDEAFANVAKTITTSLISAVIEYGARQAAFYALDAAGFIATESTKTAAVTTATATQTAAATTAIGALTAAQVASGTAITAAMAPAAAATSVATAGAAPAAAAPIALGSIGAIIAALVGGLALGSTFGRALGGQVNRNQPYLVGERGPELFTPNSSGNGRITPFNQLVNSQGGSGETVNKTANITFALPEGNADFRQRVSQNRDLFYNIVQQAMNDRGMRMGGRR